LVLLLSGACANTAEQGINIPSPAASIAVRILLNHVLCPVLFPAEINLIFAFSLLPFAATVHLVFQAVRAPAEQFSA
jgi:hypothetical protein